MSCSPSHHVLIIAEKSKAAKKIVDALSTNYKECKKDGVKFWVFNKGGQTYVVAPAAGHLFGLDGPSGFPVFETEWKPLWEIDKSSYYTRKFYFLLKSLSKGAKSFINACDYDIEGSLIGYLIIKHFGDLSRARRMKFSSLTRDELVRAFENLQPLDVSMVNAGIARHKVDWLWGINVSRALMDAVKRASNRRIILSAGRVQSPTLIEVVRNSVERLTFVPLPQFKVKLTIKLGDREIKVTLEKNFDDLQRAKDVAQRLKGSKVKVIEVEEETTAIPRPYPFNLGDLQAEAGRLLGFSPYATERVAESLYLNGLISYPRTNSQKLPSGLDFNSVLNGLRLKFDKLVELTLKLSDGKPTPHNGPKEDPAHPAIYPTGERPGKLDQREFKLYDLIVRRFLATLSADAKATVQTVKLKLVTGDVVALTNRKVTFKGWLLIYPYVKVEESEILDVEEGEEGEVKEAKILTSLTKPPRPFSKVSLLKWMEESEIGTEATRGRIIETLFTRKYLKNEKGKVVPTPLGIAVSKVLSTYFGDLTSVELTRELERDLEEIKRGKKTIEEVEEETKNIILELIRQYREKSIEIGRELGAYLRLLSYEKCRLCWLPAYKSGYCELHYRAKEALDAALKEWERRGIDKEKAIKMLLKSRSTGEYVKDLMRVMPTDR